MTITEQQLLNLKRTASEVRDNALQAKATMKEVVSSIESYKNELKQLGINDVENIDQEIAKAEEEIQKIYSEAAEKLKDWMQ